MGTFTKMYHGANTIFYWHIEFRNAYTKIKNIYDSEKNLQELDNYFIH